MSGPPTILVELNEATAHFLHKFIDAGRLPNLARVVGEGVEAATYIPHQDETDPRFRRHISPWIIWPTIYTGMLPEEHGLVAFGQDTRHLAGKYVWDVLGAAGVSYGVFGSLLSYPPRTDSVFYMPEALADTPDCHPKSLEPLQSFLTFGAHHYSDEFGPAAAVAATRRLIAAMGAGVAVGTALKTVTQVPREWISGPVARPERAMLYSYLALDGFSRIYTRTRPTFATLHFNHVAYMQHRFWRAAEPERFKPELSSTDRRFFATVEEREKTERRYARWIERSYVWTDDMIGRLMALLPDGGVLVIAGALGQHPYDPVSELHNPVVRLADPERLFTALGLEGFSVHHEMNPDLTVNFADDTAAKAAETMVTGLYVDPEQPLFVCQRRGPQLFLELEVPPLLQHHPDAAVRHRSLNSLVVPAAECIWQAPSNEQSTAHHDGTGLLLAWRKGGRMMPNAAEVSVTDIAPTLLALFGQPPAPWHGDGWQPAFV